MLAAQHGWLSPLPPEGASAALHRTAERAPEVAGALGIAAAALRRNGIVDRVIVEQPDAADEPETFLRSASAALAQELDALRVRDRDERLAARHQRYRLLTFA